MPPPAPAPLPSATSATSATATTSAPARRRRKAARPQELQQAALELFVEKGYAATRAEEVAARAGVSKGTLYLYFPSKEELFKAVLRHNLVALIAEGQQRADRFDGSSAELLRRLLHGWWARVGSTAAGGIFKVIVAEVRNFPELAQFYQQEVQMPARRLIGGTLQRGIRRGEFRPVPVAETALALIAPMLFLALHRHSVGACAAPQERLDAYALLDAQLDLVLHGLLQPDRAAPVRPRPAPARPPRRRAGGTRAPAP
ncbi:MAG: TetR/AcrR family transcriptional regulator [Proteobacteria bacterium]|nr:TetR/AcrR family transcriptional regulator [Pseudomonadota bacterium]